MSELLETTPIQKHKQNTPIQKRSEKYHKSSLQTHKIQEHSKTLNEKSSKVVSKNAETSDTDTKIKEQHVLYDRYAFNPTPFNPNLPIYEFRDEILKQIRDSPVVVIQGDTGCGKSTQVPQFILDESFKNGDFCNIIVTQPRRIAAITLSEQVSKERGYQNNTLVGYQIALDRKVNEDTRVTFCTTGILLEKLIGSKRMDMYTHIILDEIHERDEEMEFLLIAIKRFMLENPFQTKIILMSATIDTQQFAEYFQLPAPNGRKLHVPTVFLTTQRQFSIKTYYLDGLKWLETPQAFVNYEKPGIEKQMYKVACSIITKFSKPEYTVNGFCFLVFLPGIHEIAEMHRTLEAERER